eukprot:702807-Prymnesium_polylepis.1
MFKLADQDGDRQLSKDEFHGFCKTARVPKKRAATLWQQIDQDMNGSIKYKELKAFADDLIAPETLRRMFRERSTEG